MMYAAYRRAGGEALVRFLPVGESNRDHARRWNEMSDGRGVRDEFGRTQEASNVLRVNHLRLSPT